MTDVESQQRELQQRKMPNTSTYSINFKVTADRIPASENPNLHLSSEERRLFGQLFSQADTDKIGVVTGEIAVKFFEKTRLPPDVLGEVSGDTRLTPSAETQADLLEKYRSGR